MNVSSTPSFIREASAHVVATCDNNGEHHQSALITADADLPPFVENSLLASRLRGTGPHIQTSAGDSDAVILVAEATLPKPRLDTYLWDAAFGSAGKPPPRRVQGVNGIIYFSKKGPLTGAYAVDPALPRAHDPNGREAIYAEREHAREAERAENGWSWNWRLKQTVRKRHDAAFTTRQGNISIDLSIVTTVDTASLETPGTTIPAFVSASSRHADIVLNVTEVQRDRSLKLDVSTRTGNILLLLPASFSGRITCHSGDVDEDHTTLLPGIAPHCSSVRRTRHKTTVAVNGASPNLNRSIAQLTGQGRCVISTRTGRVAVGLSGVDEADPHILWPESTLRRLGKAVEVGHLEGV